MKKNQRLEERRMDVPQSTKDYVEIQWLKEENKRLREAIIEIGDHLNAFIPDDDLMREIDGIIKSALKKQPKKRSK